MRRNTSVLSVLIVSGLLLTFFQNCGSQNYDLNQKLQENSGSPLGDGGAGVDPDPVATPIPGAGDGAPAHTGTPVPPTPTPVPGDLSTNAQLCALENGSKIANVEVRVAEDVPATDNKSAAQNFAAGKILPNFKLYMSRIAGYYNNVDTNGIRINGTEVKGANGSVLKQNFAIRYNTHLQLQGEQAPGLYQLGIVASGKVELELNKGNGFEASDLASAKTPYNGYRIHCAEPFEIKRGDQFPLQIYQTHADGSSVGATVVLRQVTAENQIFNSVYCGKAGLSSTAIRGFLEGNGWVDISASQQHLLLDSANLLVNGSFEAFESEIADGNWKYYSKSDLENRADAGWRVPYNLEVQRKFEGLSATDGRVFAELDAGNELDSIHQSVQTDLGKYRILIDYRPRLAPHDGFSDNGIYVTWGKKPLGSLEMNVKDWTTVMFEADGFNGPTDLIFAESPGSSNSYGGMIDNIRVRRINTLDVCK